MLGVVLALPELALADLRAARGHPIRARPDERLAGLSLALRSALTLQKEGVSRLVLVIRSGDEPLLEWLRAEPRVRLPVAGVVVSPDETAQAPAPPCCDGMTPMGRAALLALQAEVTEPFLLGRYDVVVDPAIYRLLRDTPLGTTKGSAAAQDGALIGPLCGTPELLCALKSLDARALRKLAEEGSLGLVPMGERWAVALGTQADRRQASLHLFEACRKSVDGLVARYLNRHVSLWISKRLVDTPVSPNAMTIVTFLIGLAGAAVAMQGGYVPFLVGAALMQLNSILDGVDGELARVRFQHSKLGQWLDTIGDDASNLLFYAALAWGVRSGPAGPWLSLAGWIVTAATLLTAALYYSELIGSGSGDLYAIEWELDKRPPKGLGGKLVRFGRLVLKQDFFIFLWLVLASFGMLGWALPMFALGGTITVVAATGRRIGLIRARRRAAGEAQRIKK